MSKTFYVNWIKRPIDFFCALFALLILSPIFLVTMIVLTFANKGAGVFFTQPRPGKNGKVFNVIKFKSMTDERDKDGKLLPNELRITKAGQFIRKYSIDELPQLINVLKGDMAVIGPRPLKVAYLELYSKEQAKRHDVRPGMSGWAQVHGRNSISWTEKFKLDVWYVDHVSLFVDIKIIIMTIVNVLSHKDINTKEQGVGGVAFNGHN